MRKQTRVLLGGTIWLAAALALLARPASAQNPAQNIDKFVITGEAAKKAMSRSEISGDTAAKIAQVCLDYAKQHNVAVSIFILSPSGEIVHAHRMDGQNPINIDTALMKAHTALYMRDSTHAVANRSNGNIPQLLRYLPDLACLSSNRLASANLRSEKLAIPQYSY